MVWLLIQNFVFRLVYQKAGGPSDMKPGRVYRITGILSMLLWLLSTAYSVFLPLKTGTVWFAAGLIVFLLGLFVDIASTVSFARTPQNMPVTGGIYRYSRHPIYVSLVMIYLGTGIASASWLFLLITGLVVVEWVCPCPKKNVLPGEIRQQIP
jgi:protein-S-isoprenylcysteine O-methyltransferase Ste14